MKFIVDKHPSYLTYTTNAFDESGESYYPASDTLTLLHGSIRSSAYGNIEEIYVVSFDITSGSGANCDEC